MYFFFMYSALEMCLLHTSGFVFFISCGNFLAIISSNVAFSRYLYILLLKIQLVIFFNFSLYFPYIITSFWYFLSPCLPTLHSGKEISSDISFSLLIHSSAMFYLAIYIEFFISTIIFYICNKLHIFYVLICLVIPNNLLLLARLCGFICYFFKHFISFLFNQ